MSHYKGGKRINHSALRYSAEDWETLVGWLETIEDATIAQQAFAPLKAAGGDRAKAGWRKWSEAEGKLT
jgi:hypothetical protein